MTDLYLPGVPFPLEPTGTPECRAVVSAGMLTLTSGAKSDLFIDPAGDEGARPDAGRLTGLPGDQDFTLKARVTVRFDSVFDAGVLLLYLSERRWAKLCYELSPQGRPSAVTVVTRGMSDDSYSFATSGEPLWLRITRSGRVWAFHTSEDGAFWRLVRYFTLGEAVRAPASASWPSRRAVTAAPRSSTACPTRPARRPTSGTAARRPSPTRRPRR